MCAENDLKMRRLIEEARKSTEDALKKQALADSARDSEKGLGSEIPVGERENSGCYESLKTADLAATKIEKPQKKEEPPKK